jgi:hypothetical protein
MELQPTVEIVIARIDERTANMSREITEIKNRLDKINDKVCEQDDRIHTQDIKVSNLEQYGKNNRSLILWIGGITAVIILGVVLYVLAHVGFPGGA